MSESKKKDERAAKKNMNREVAEGLILSKLYKDGFFTMDEVKKTAIVDARRRHIVDMYGESSYEDVSSILNRTAKGLEKNGYKVTVKVLELVAP